MKSPSAFPGRIENIPFISVDNFENENKIAYFLSHFHTDHIIGLKSKNLCIYLKTNNVYIYTSKVTVAIIEKEWPSLTPYLKILDLGSNTLSFKVEEKEVFLNVTVLPAGHSLGSVMYLFEYENKKILFTGDFRISRNTVSKYAHLHSNGEPIDLDILYVDTTFQKASSFPKRSDVVRNIVINIKNWLNLSESHRVEILTPAYYGYEYVGNIIYDETGMKVYFSNSHWNIYRQFPKEIYGMTGDPSSRIHMSLRNKGNSDSFTLTVYLSAWKWKDGENVEEDFLTVENNRIDACFSTHNSREELIHFINYLKPKRIVGFPEPFDENYRANVLPDEFNIEPVGSFKISPRKRKIARDKEVKAGKRVSKSVLKEALDW